MIPKHLEAISAKLLEIGCEVEEFDDAVRVVASKPLRHTQVTTLPYPGFPDGYAAADDSCAGSGPGNEYRDGEHFREPF